MNEEVCKEKHKHIDDKLTEHKGYFDEIFPRLNELEKTAEKVEQQILNVCEKLGGLTTAIWWFVGSLLVASGSFIIWYIQNHK